MPTHEVPQASGSRLSAPSLAFTPQSLAEALGLSSGTEVPPDSTEGVGSHPESHTFWISNTTPSSFDSEKRTTTDSDFYAGPSPDAVSRQRQGLGDSRQSAPPRVVTPPTKPLIRPRLAENHTFIVSAISTSGAGGVYVFERNLLLDTKERFLVLKVSRIKNNLWSSRMEIEAMNRIKAHPHTNVMLQPRDLGEEIDTVWWSRKYASISMILNYYPINLERLIWHWNTSGTHPSPPIIEKVISDISNGLVHLHDLGIIHTNINPLDILIDFDGNCRIGGFGSAFVLIESVRLDGNAICRSSVNEEFCVDYAAPEFCMSVRGKDDLDYTYFDESVDFWSLGVCIYAMITGSVPEMDYKHFPKLGWRFAKDPADFPVKLIESLRYYLAERDMGSKFDPIFNFFGKCHQIYPKNRLHGEDALLTISMWSIEHDVLKNMFCIPDIFPNRTRQSRHPQHSAVMSPPENREISPEFERHLKDAHVAIPEHSGYRMREYVPV